MTTTRIEPELVLTTESPDQPTHPTSLGSTMALAIGKEADVSKAVFSEAEAVAEETERARHEAALRRASGPYLTPEFVGIEWYAQPHPAPWMRWVLMTAEIAGYLLREHNTDNRPLNPERVQHYKRIYMSKRWRLTHQGAAMDSRGTVQDGQHRFAALVEASNELDEDLEVPMVFFVGMPPENFSAIDEGRNRSAQDLFAKGGVKYGSIVTTMVRLAIAFNDQNPKKRIREKQPNDVILEYYANNDAEQMQAAAKFGSTHWKKTFSTAGPLATAHYLLRRANGPDNVYLEAFLEGLVTGRKAGTRISLDDDDPREVLRNYLRNVKFDHRRLPGMEALSLIVIAWNNTVAGKRPRNVNYRSDSAIPRITLCADRGPNKSACPAALVGEIAEVEA